MLHGASVIEYIKTNKDTLVRSTLEETVNGKAVVAGFNVKTFLGQRQFVILRQAGQYYTYDMATCVENLIQQHPVLGLPFAWIENKVEWKIILRAREVSIPKEDVEKIRELKFIRMVCERDYQEGLNPLDMLRKAGLNVAFEYLNGTNDFFLMENTAEAISEELNVDCSNTIFILLDNSDESDYKVILFASGYRIDRDSVESTKWYSK